MITDRVVAPGLMYSSTTDTLPQLPLFNEILIESWFKKGFEKGGEIARRRTLASILHLWRLLTVNSESSQIEGSQMGFISAKGHYNYLSNKSYFR